MKHRRIFAGALLTLVLTGSAYLTLRSLGIFERSTDYRPVPKGHQEIAFLAPATSGDSWERLVAAVDALETEAQKGGNGKRRLHVSKQRAFVELTADVPEVSLWLEGCEDARLWIRWYKLSGEMNTKQWIGRLTERPTPPLAIIGGDTSSRALKLADALEAHRNDWQGPAPLLMITTATVDRYIPGGTPNTTTIDEQWPLLIDKYKGRSFRFSFNNARMAAVVLDFLRTHDALWPNAPIPGGVTSACAAGGAPATAAMLATDQVLSTCLYNLKWNDDSFSADLADRFRVLFEKKFPWPHVSPNEIEYSVGDFYLPNPREAFVAGLIVQDGLKLMREHRQLLLLPTGTERARRFLRTVIRRSAPEDWKNLIVTAGDSLNFNTIYRDRDVAWNIQDLPVPLVLFSHRNPVAEEVGFHEPVGTGTVASGTGTEDLLLYRDILEAILLTAYTEQSLTASADELQRGMRHLRWHERRVWLGPDGGPEPLLFNPKDGNRNDDTGEHIVVLLPQAEERATVTQAKIQVWRIEGDASRFESWILVRELTVGYDGLSPTRPDP
jgi:hypothetical protein